MKISKFILLSTCIILLISCTSTSFKNRIKQSSFPNIKFDHLTYDFQIAGPARKIHHTFRFTNTGSKTLVIDRLNTDCGCTAAMISEKNIQPGKSGAIKTTFETKKYEGKQKKSITVYSNDPDNPEIQLVIKGIIKRHVAVVPQGINFGNVIIGQGANGSIKLLQLSNEKLILHKIENNNKYLNIFTSTLQEENNEGILINVSLKPEAPVGVFSDIITLHTNLKKRPRIDVPVWANIKRR